MAYFFLGGILMTITKLKTKNQLTLPIEIVKKLHLKVNELFAVELKENYIKLTPVDVEPRYTESELQAIDHLVERKKNHGKIMKPGKEFSEYIRKITR